MNVIFLDIDGVLNSLNYFKKRYPKVKELSQNNYNYDIVYKFKRLMLDIDINKLKILKELIQETNSFVVITSSWKNLEAFFYVKEQLISMGIPIIGATIDNSSNRGKGIKRYLKENDVKKYIILDDDIFEDYDEELLKHLVKTSFVNDGLTEEHKKKAIEILANSVKEEVKSKNEVEVPNSVCLDEKGSFKETDPKLIRKKEDK